MDNLHLSNFKEIRLKSKGDFDIAYYAVIDTNLAVPILWQTIINQIIHWSLKEKDNISHNHSSYSFPMKFEQNFQKLYW